LNARTRSSVQGGQSIPGWGDQSSDRLGFDGASRQITKRYLAGGINGTTHAYNDSNAVVGMTSAYDRSSNKFYERELHAESRSHLYQPFSSGVPQGGYDSIDRMRQYQRGTLSSTGGPGGDGGGSVTTPINLSKTDESRTYDLDGLGNWKDTVFTPVGGSQTTQVRDHNKVNQITETDDGSSEMDFTYDGTTGASNGNLKDDGVRTYEWDALNRLKTVKRKSDSQTIGEYTYDAMGRRVRKVISNGGLSTNITNGTVDFVYADAGVQCSEERDGSNNPTNQYVWGIYIDELIQQKHDISGTPADRYMLSDLLYRSVALSDSGGSIVEAYDTDAYGNTLIFDAAGTGGDWFADDATQTDEPTCDYIFTGRRFDPETEIYFYRTRYYLPEQGRFISRDSLDYPDGMNAYAYVGGRAIVDVDPFGRAKLTAKDITNNYRSVVKTTRIQGIGAHSHLHDFDGSYGCFRIGAREATCEDCRSSCDYEYGGYQRLDEPGFFRILPGEAEIVFIMVLSNRNKASYGHEQNHMRHAINTLNSRLTKLFADPKWYCQSRTKKMCVANARALQGRFKVAVRVAAEETARHRRGGNIPPAENAPYGNDADFGPHGRIRDAGPLDAKALQGLGLTGRGWRCYGAGGAAAAGRMKALVPRHPNVQRGMIRQGSHPQAQER